MRLGVRCSRLRQRGGSQGMAWQWRRRCHGSVLTTDTVVVGAGPCGSLLAILLAQQGQRVTVVDPGPRPTAALTCARPVGILLSQRGRHALAEAGLTDAQVAACGPATVGRCVHPLARGPAYLPWSPDEDATPWTQTAVSRDRLLALLWHRASAHRGRIRYVRGCFRGAERAPAPHSLVHVHLDAAHGEQRAVRAALLVGADGTHSAVRAAAGIAFERPCIAHAYKPVHMRPEPGLLRPRSGSAANAWVHTYPRGSWFLHCTPQFSRDHDDASAATASEWAGTLVLPTKVARALEHEADEARVWSMFEHLVPQLRRLCPTFAAQFVQRTASPLATVNCEHALHGERHGPVVLVGDAAHGTVPFAGQGMNAALEDAVLLAHLVSRVPRSGSATAMLCLARTWTHERKPDTDAMLQLSLRAYTLLAHSHASVGWKRRTAYQGVMHRLLPSRYAPTLMSMLNGPNYVPYAHALAAVMHQNQPWKFGRL